MILYKDTSSEVRTVSVGTGSWFYDSNYGSSIAAKNAAEADARSRLLQQYPKATNIVVSSGNYYYDYGNGISDRYGWCASATGTIPAKSAEKDKTEKVTTGYGVVTDCVKRAKETAKKKLKKNYPGVKNITTKCERTPEGGFVAKADGVVEKETKRKDSKTNIGNGEKMKTVKVNVDHNGWFHTSIYGSPKAAAEAAEIDAKDRLRRSNPFAINITAHSFMIGPYPQEIWVATAEGEVPVGTTEQDEKQTNENNVNRISIPLNVWFKNMADAHTYIGLFLQQSFGDKLVSYKASFTTKLDKPVCEPGMPIPYLSQQQLNSANNLATRIECVLEVEYI